MTTSNSRDVELRARAARVIPGGMYGHQSVARLPEGYPQFFSRAEGCRLWDADGNELIDFMCAYGPNLLGYRRPEVEEAARRQAERGDAMTGPSGVMVELAERITGAVSHADWAMFTKNGADSTNSAIQIARAYRGRNKILVAQGSYHGAAFWSTPRPVGVPDADRSHLIGFRYNDIASLDAAAAQAGDDLAAIMVTAYKHDAMVDNALVDAAFARRCRELADAADALLIVDEVRAGSPTIAPGPWSVSPPTSAPGARCSPTAMPFRPTWATTGRARPRPASSSPAATGLPPCPWPPRSPPWT